MRNNVNIQFFGRLMAVSLATSLAACGGGGGSTASTPTVTTSPIATASQTTATAVSATSITPATADTTLLAGANTAYDLTAAMGDSWRLLLNTTTNKFAIRVLTTAYSLNNSIVGTLSTTTSGSFITYSGTATDGASFTVTVDTRTNSLSGTVKLAGMTTTSGVMGTGIIATKVSALAGDYVFANAAHNIDGTNQNSALGTLHVETTGLVELCASGVVNTTHDACTNMGGNLAVQTMVYAQLTVDQASGQIVFGTDTTHPTSTINPNGRLSMVHVQAGDLGPVLVIDQDWLNQYSNRRTGVFLAAPKTALVPSSVAGSYSCNGPTIPVGATITLTSNSFTTGGGATGSGNVYFNEVTDGTLTSTTPNVFALNGAIVLYSTDIANSTPRTGFALSSSAFVWQNSANSLNYCIRNS